MADEVVQTISPALQALPWHHSNWQLLLNQQLRQTLPHAILFAGQAGCGKKILIQAWAARLLCQAPAEWACGQCKSCRWYQQTSHPDVFHIAYQSGATIKIDEIRAVGDFVAKTSQQGGYKIILIEESNRMTLASANALLKILEEPTPHTLFLLTSDNIALLPATLRSRCQVLRSPLPDRTQALTWLADKITESTQASFLLDFTSGAPLQALALAQQSQINMASLQQRVLAVISGTHDPVALATEWLAEQELSHIVAYLQWWTYRLASQGDPGSPGLQSADAHGNFLLSAVFSYWDELLAARAALDSHANLNPLLLLEGLLIRLSHLADGVRTARL